MEDQTSVSRKVGAIAVGGLVASALAAGSVLGSSGALAGPGSKTPEGKVTICHRTNSIENPYNEVTVNVSAIDGEGQGDHYHNHTGPVWRPWFQQGDDWGDIIPPVAGAHGGLNWGRFGRWLWKSGCRFESPVRPTPTGTSSPTGSSTPVPTGIIEPSQSPSGSAVPTTTNSPTASPPSPTPTTPTPTTPTPTPTTPTQRPSVPIVIVPGGGDPGTGGWATVVKEAKSAGNLRVKLSCSINGVRQDNLCRKAIKHQTIRVKSLCSDNVTVRVYLIARRDGMTPQRWKGSWRLDTTGSPVCRAHGNG